MELLGIDLVIWIGLVVASGMALLVIWKIAQWKGRFDQWRREVDERLDGGAASGAGHDAAYDAASYDATAPAATPTVTSTQTPALVQTPAPTMTQSPDPASMSMQGLQDRSTSGLPESGPLSEYVDAKTVMQMESALLDALSGRTDEAVERLKAAGREIGINTPDDVAMAHHNLGNLLYRSKQFDEAEREYCEAIKCKPDLARAHANLGFLYQRLGRREASLQEFEAALKLKDQLPDGGKRVTQIVEDLSGGN
ncbi:MAG: tetratricopeptide repeat protein [Euryarchaeota archaeon]|nr:tetratricopeptide repeat protein [Euryarchaeota archaeon]